MMPRFFLSALLLVMVSSFQVNVPIYAADPFEQRRLFLVKEYVEKEGITNQRVLKSMRQTKRHMFVPTSNWPRAYSDQALSIGHNQTISPPFIVAYMTQILDPQPTDKVLEIGTGSGYQAAVLSPLVKDVYTIEIVEPLGKRAKAMLKRLGYKNVHPRIGDGFKGWPEEAPFDKIIVTCSPEKVPRPLIEQLKEGGKMLIPLGERYQQVFYLFEKKEGKLEIEKLEPTLFVPMTGQSEKLRKVKPDPNHPKLVNGSFEEDENNDGMFDGWHYQRRVTRIKGDAPDGDYYLVFENDQLGQTSHMAQGFAIDGRNVKTIRVSIDVKLSEWKRGPRGERPGFIIYYYDAKRRPLTSQRIGQWETSETWQHLDRTVTVPVNAREAIVQIGLNAAAGKVAVDNVSLKAVGP